jgi:hypothetical protein
MLGKSSDTLPPSLSLSPGHSPQTKSPGYSTVSLTTDAMIYCFSVSVDGPQKSRGEKRGEGRRETYPQNPRRVYELENEPKSGRQEDTGVRLVPTRIKDWKPR